MLLSLPVLLSLAQIPALQGSTMRLNDPNAAEARLAGHTVRLFRQPDGSNLALMPVEALQKPGPYTLEYLDGKGAVIRSEPVVVKNARFPTQNLVISKRLSTLKAAPGEQETVTAFRTAVSDVRLWTEPLRLPVPGCMTSPFGVRRLHNGKPTGDFHAGLDQRGAAGSPIHAITGGTVRISRMFQLRGGTVAIDHGQGLSSIYMHMSRVLAKEGATVQPGDVIGEVGSTGRSTAPHLHWTLYVFGVPVNPAQWVQVERCQ